MLERLKHGAQYFEHPAVDRLRDINWENLRVFLCLARTRSFRRAAGELGMSPATVSNKLTSLERELGAKLGTRDVVGLHLTPEGAQLCDAARQMEEVAYGVQRLARTGFAELRGRVSVSVTEGIGTFWVMPRLVDFQRAHPKLTVEVNCTMRPADVGRLEADIGIQLFRPDQGSLIATKIGRLHNRFFGSPEYIRTYGDPKTLDDMYRHKIVKQISPQIDVDAYMRVFPDAPREGFIAFETNTSTTHYWAVAKGAGLGALPTYLWAVDARVQPVSFDFHNHYDIWMVFHPDVRRLKRVALTAKWLKSLFDPHNFPWFRDDYLSPQQLVDLIGDRVTPNLFDGFAGRQEH